MQHMLKIKEQTIQTLRLQLQTYQEEAKKEHQLIQKLEVEREGYSKEAMSTKQRCIEQVRQFTFILTVDHVLLLDGRSEAEGDGIVPTEKEDC